MKILDKSTLSEQVADILRDQIIHGEYPQGEKMLEEYLSKTFDVSRATIREALRTLETEGILDREVNKHTCVHKFTSKEIRALFAVRRMLEEQSLDFCVENKCIPVDKLNQFIVQMDEDTRKGWSAWNEYLIADVGFHREIINAVGNKYILMFWENLKSQYMMAIYMLRKYNPDAFFATNEEHKAMLKALTEHDTAEWKKHLRTLDKDVEDMTNRLIKIKALPE